MPASNSSNFIFHMFLHKSWTNFKNLLMPLFLMGCFQWIFKRYKRPLRTKSVNAPLRSENGPFNDGKRPIKAMVLVGNFSRLLTFVDEKIHY